MINKNKGLEMTKIRPNEKIKLKNKIKILLMKMKINLIQMEN